MTFLYIVQGGQKSIGRTFFRNSSWDWISISTKFFYTKKIGGLNFYGGVFFTTEKKKWILKFNSPKKIETENNGKQKNRFRKLPKAKKLKLKKYKGKKIEIENYQR